MESEGGERRRSDEWIGRVQGVETVDGPGMSTSWTGSLGSGVEGRRAELDGGGAVELDLRSQTPSTVWGG